MIDAQGAGTAPAVNTDARPADTAQDVDAQLTAFFAADDDDAGGPEQALQHGGADQASGRDEDPENLFGETAEKAEPETSDDTGEARPAGKITLADGTQVTAEQVQEWREAGLRTADYTRKTQEVAEQRRSLEAHTGELAGHHNAVAEALERVLSVVEAYVPLPPSTDLAIADPARYTQEMAIYQAALNNVEEITRQRLQLNGRADSMAQSERHRLVETERERLFAAIPELREGSKRAAFNQEMLKAVEVYGFSEADYAQILDHRLIRVLADAARYQKIKQASGRGKPRPDATRSPQPFAPGRRQAGPAGGDVASALTRAKRSGTKADTARAIDAWLAED
jgi:hypothetical protein